MIRFTFEMEDVEMVIHPTTDGWDVLLRPANPAIRDLSDQTPPVLLRATDLQVACLMALVANEDKLMWAAEMYDVVEPLLVDVPQALRPIP